MIGIILFSSFSFSYIYFPVSTNSFQVSGTGLLCLSNNDLLENKIEYFSNNG